MKPVSPRLTLYLAQKGDSEFHPVMLQEVTVSELLKNISDIVEVNNDDSVVSGGMFICMLLQAPNGLFNKVLVEGPNNISIRLTDEFLR